MPEDDCDTSAVVAYKDFEERVPPATRSAIEARLTEDGVLPSLYVSPEQWVDTKTAKELQWQQLVQMQAQRGGNQLRQNDILSNELGKQ